MDLEKLISSSCRRRIINFLWKVHSANVMELARKVNSTYNQVNSNLLILAHGRERIIKLDKENPKTTLLLEALKILNRQKYTEHSVKLNP